MDDMTKQAMQPAALLQEGVGIADVLRARGAEEQLYVQARFAKWKLVRDLLMVK
jgi:hypothetical protein